MPIRIIEIIRAPERFLVIFDYQSEIDELAVIARNTPEFAVLMHKCVAPLANRFMLL